MPNLHPNSTDYVHSYEPNTNDLTMAMDYTEDGKPAIRVLSNIQGDIVIEGNVTIPGEVTVVNSDEDPLFTHTHLYDENDAEYTDSNPFTVDGTVNIGTMPNVTVNQPIAVTDNNGSLTVDGTVSVDNFPATQTVDGTVTIQDGGGSITVDGAVSITSGNFSFGGTSVDAFGRLRVSNPVTLFDSFHRYADNGFFATSVNGVGSTATFNATQGLIDITIGTASGNYVYRETLRVFAYQPGKSLLIFTTFIFNEPKVNLRQRVGYFGINNGFYLEANGTAIRFVKRTSVTGSVINTVIEQAAWNIDPMDGTGPSGITLDPSKAQILFIDMEWLGLGTVRMGFVIDGKIVHCHSFHHANILTTTYITTACLPLRLEIENTGVTATASTMKQVCSTVISEGGYEIRGRSRSLGLATDGARDLTNANTFYPLVSIRLKSTTPDCIVAPTGFSMLGKSTGNYRYKLVKQATITGGTWMPLTNSNIEYNITGTAITGGEDLEMGYFATSNQSTGFVPSTTDIFRYQLERDSFAGIYYTFTLAVQSDGGGDDVYGSLNWQEIT